MGHEREYLLEHLYKGLIVGTADIVRVEISQLGEIEAGGGPADAGKVEGGNHFLRRENLLIAVAPSEPDQIIAQRRRQIAHGAVGVDAECAVTLGKFRTVRPGDQGNMR